MRAFDRDGHELWRTPIVGQPLSAQFSPRGRVLFVTHVGVVYLLDRRTGRPVIAPMELVPGATWEPAQGMWACARGTAACPSANTIAVDERTGRFFFTFWAPGAESAGIRAMEVDERGTTRIRTLWSNDDLPGGSGSSPDLSPDGSRLYVTDNVDSLHTIDARTGKEVWKLRIGVAPAGSLSSSPDGLLIPTGGPLQAIRDTGSAGVVAWRDESLLSRGIATQARGHRAYATIAAAGGGNDLVVVDTRTGRELDREPMPGATRFSVGTTMALDGTVLVPTIAGDLFAFRAAR
jgi:outer membrane protein assembly factor BamB